ALRTSAGCPVGDRARGPDMLLISHHRQQRGHEHGRRYGSTSGVGGRVHRPDGRTGGPGTGQGGDRGERRGGRLPGCGVLSSRVKDRPVIVVKDLKACGQVVDLCWRKRRLTCQESGCSRATFTRQSEQIPARSRVTARLRAALAKAIARSNRAVSDVAAEHEVSWHTAQDRKSTRLNSSHVNISYAVFC